MNSHSKKRSVFNKSKKLASEFKIKKTKKSKKTPKTQPDHKLYGRGGGLELDVDLINSYDNTINMSQTNRDELKNAYLKAVTIPNDITRNDFLKIIDDFRVFFNNNSSSHDYLSMSSNIPETTLATSAFLNTTPSTSSTSVFPKRSYSTTDFTDFADSSEEELTVTESTEDLKSVQSISTKNGNLSNKKAKTKNNEPDVSNTVHIKKSIHLNLRSATMDLKNSKIKLTELPIYVQCLLKEQKMHTSIPMECNVSHTLSLCQENIEHLKERNISFQQSKFRSHIIDIGDNKLVKIIEIMTLPSLPSLTNLKINSKQNFVSKLQNETHNKTDNHFDAYEPELVFFLTKCLFQLSALNILSREKNAVLQINKLYEFGIFQLSDNLVQELFLSGNFLANELQRIFLYMICEKIVNPIYRSPNEMYRELIAKDLNILHYNGLHHLDIADRNILITYKQPILIDFLDASNKSETVDQNKDYSDTMQLWKNVSGKDVDIPANKSDFAIIRNNAILEKSHYRDMITETSQNKNHTVQKLVPIIKNHRD